LKLSSTTSRYQVDSKINTSPGSKVEDSEVYSREILFAFQSDAKGSTFKAIELILKDKKLTIPES